MINKKIFLFMGIIFLLSPLIINRNSFSVTPTTATIDSSAKADTSVISSSLAVTFSTNNPRDLIIVAVMFSNNSGIASCTVGSVSDTSTLTWFKLGSSNGAVSFMAQEVWYAISTSGNVLSGDVITVTTTASAKCTYGIFATGVTGVSLGTPFDDGIVFNSGSSTMPVAQITTNFPNDLILGFQQNFGTGNTPNTGFTQYISGNPTGSENLRTYGLSQPLATTNTLYKTGSTIGTSNNWEISTLLVQSLNQVASVSIPDSTVAFFILFVLLSLLLDFIPFFIGRIGYGGLIIELISAIFGVYFYLSMQEANGEFNIVFTDFPTTIFIPMLLTMFSFILFFGLVFKKLR